MTYDVWSAQHKLKVVNILGRLRLSTPEEIAAYFMYDNMVKKEKDFCVLYKDNIKCHNMDDLNCYYCGCPYFVLNKTLIMEDGKTTASLCKINSKYKAEYHELKDDGVYVHTDCTNCYIPHKTSYVLKELINESNAYKKITDFSSFIAYLRNTQGITSYNE